MPTKYKEIPLSGLSTSPSDYACDDGNLAIAVGLLHTDGAITASSPSAPSVVAGSLGSDKILYQHVGSDFHHLIRKTSEGYVWQDRDDEREQGTFTSLSGDVTSVVAVGNALIFYTATQPYYYLWSNLASGNMGYVELGSSIPNIPVSFGLSAHSYRALEDMHGYTVEQIKSTYEADLRDFLTTFILDYNTFDFTTKTSIPMADRETVANAVFSNVNHFQGKWCNENGYFSQPFLLRYAIRLFDNSLVCHSAPILIVPADGLNPHVLIQNRKIDVDEEKVYVSIDTVAVACSLRYALNINNDLLDKFGKWRDLIRSIDVFVSAPIYTYDATKQIEKVSYIPGETTRTNNAFYNFANERLTYSSHHSDSPADSKREFIYEFSQDQRFTAFVTYTEYDREHRREYLPTNWEIELPARQQKDIIEDIRTCSTFYHLFSIELNDIIEGKYNAGQWYNADVPTGSLASLVTREVMTDDFDSRHVIVPDGMMTYNNRLNLFDVTKHFFEGYSANELYQRIYNASVDESFIAHLYTFVYGNNGAHPIVVRHDDNLFMSLHAPMDYFYYPDPSARRVVQLAVVDGPEALFYRRSFTLREHEGLNGAVHFETIADSSESWTSIEPSELTEFINTEPLYNDIPLPNALYTSETDNPFTFLAKNSEQIGSGKIIAIASAAEPLSQGQVGDFPAYAFTTEGIWALYPNDTGGWSSKQIISPDVPISREAMLTVDKSVIFATHRGLMEITGRKVTCISEVFDGPDDTFTEAYAAHLAHLIHHNTDLSVFLPQPSMAAPSFRDFVGSGIYVYDYRNQRIIIGNPSHTFAYVFNMKDKLWTSMPIRITKAINSYPLAYAMIEDETQGGNVLVDFSTAGAAWDIGMPLDGFLLTRPLKLGEPDTMKTVRHIIARGKLFRQNVDIVLYGSRDLYNWVIIGDVRGNELVNRHGTGYKYFRVGIISRMSATESLSGLTIEYETKQTNKPR